jgi:hypothetical protein
VVVDVVVDFDGDGNGNVDDRAQREPLTTEISSLTRQRLSDHVAVAVAV